MQLPAGVSALYSWRCSPLNVTSNQFSLPNVLDEAGFQYSPAVPDRVVSILNKNMVYVFPIPELLNCRGTASAIRYCYRVYTHTEGEYPKAIEFSLLAMEQIAEHSFRTDRVIAIYSAPTSQLCTEHFVPSVAETYYRYCCDSMSLNTIDTFRLPASNFAFGIVYDSNTALVFLTSSTGLKVERYSEAKGLVSSPPVEGTEYTFSPSSRETNNTLLLFQFYISKFVSLF